uniref:Uncharacterized protein n=1 Tax=Romanomermis culicivorax TaxID=13658 RepID=A0A915I795_ROMCU
MLNSLIRLNVSDVVDNPFRFVPSEKLPILVHRYRSSTQAGHVDVLLVLLYFQLLRFLGKTG